MSVTDYKARFWSNSINLLTIISLAGYSLILTKSVMMPFALSILLAIALYLLYRRLENWGISRIWAMVICLVVTIGVFAGLIVFINIQIVAFIRALLGS